MEVDLRSDTVTRPSPGMRRAIAEAVVGDDVIGDDPTVQQLEARVAELCGKQAALFVPSGTMGNQIAVHCLTSRGDEVLLERQSHIYLYEQGGIASTSGCLAHPVDAPRGWLDPGMIDAVVRGEDEHNARLKLVCLENTHNRHGGTVMPLDRLRGVAAAAHERGLRVHLDGARLWNASVATGIPLAQWAAHPDTVMMCFSKGLGAPVGSILVGASDLILEARRVRKRLGGGMRQVGILAAACLYALDHNLARLADDHRRAQRLAEGLRLAPGLEIQEPETNIVLVNVTDPRLDPSELLRSLGARGVHVWRFGKRQYRAITHLDVDDAGVDRAVRSFQEVITEALATQAARPA